MGGKRPQSAPAGGRGGGQDLAKLYDAIRHKPPSWTLGGGNEPRFRVPKSYSCALPPGYYKTQRQFVMSRVEEYSPECAYETTAFPYSFPTTNHFGYGGFATYMGGNAKEPTMGPGKYPAEEYQTLLGPRANCLSATARQPAYTFGGGTPKFFSIGETPSNAYKKKLGPGSYMVKDGIKASPHAEMWEAKALRDLKRFGMTSHAEQLSMMTMRSANLGPDFRAAYKPSKDDERRVEFMMRGRAT
jgi:hypothetical protein